MQVSEHIPSHREATPHATESMPVMRLLANHLCWIGILVSAPLLGFLYHDSLTFMVRAWAGDENYGHGFFVPLISLYLIWQERSRLQQLGLKGSWWGLVIVFAGIGLYVIGELATLYVLLHFSLWVVIVGLLVSAIGVPAVRVMSFPLLYLLTAMPLPNFLYQGLSSQLQLISSALGVGCLQLVGITAFREGNIIDLGPIQLQVVDACSGLRYLFPLISLALLCAYVFKDRMWKRVVLVLSSIPLSIFVNGFRIGIIGVLVELYGVGMAEGFYHLFEGGALFMVSLALLLAEMWVLSRIGATDSRRQVLEVFQPQRDQVQYATTTKPTPPAQLISRFSSSYVSSVALLILFAFVSLHIVSRDEMFPARQNLLDFPLQLGKWEGKPFAMDKQYLDVLRFDDYLLADYSGSDGRAVNLYIAYYRSQKKGQSAHSPRTCIPGGGWEISSLRGLDLSSSSSDARRLSVNRVLIQKGDQKQVVLYWFKQRDRILSNEYLVKVYLFWDALTRNRTDGALVRLTSAIEAGESEPTVETRLMEFANVIEPLLARYLPD